MSKEMINFAIIILKVIIKIFMIDTSSLQTISITNFPEISPHLKRRILAGVRPFRKGGIRLQKEVIAGKIIIHNYGHGGAGVSLAPATAQEAAILAIQQCVQKEEIGVLGCGIVGIMTALECAERGYKVKIYAERIPKESKLKDTRLSTSEVAPGYWLPYHYEFKDKKSHDIRSEKSFQKYQQWMNKSKSIRTVPVYQDMDIQEMIEKAPKFISNKCRPINMKVETNQFKLIHFETLQIHLQNFLQQLLVLCKEKGVVIVEKSFDSIDNVLQLPHRIIINSLGLGSKRVFGDGNMYGIKGHLLQITNTTQIKGIFGFKFENDPVKLYCFDDKILIGLTKEEIQTTEINEQLGKKLEQRAYKFYQSLQLGKNLNLHIKPKL